MSESSLLGRYQAYRTRRFLRREAKFRHWLPGWRSRSRRRILVGALATIFGCMIVTGVVCAFDMRIGALLWAVAALVFIAIWTALQVVSGRQGDAPRDALDEHEIQQRDSARSIGLTVTQLLVLAPVIYLIAAAVGRVEQNTAYAGGIFVLTAVIAGGCSPAMILAWSRPDPDSDDYLQEIP